MYLLAALLQTLHKSRVDGVYSKGESIACTVSVIYLNACMLQQDLPFLLFQLDISSSMQQRTQLCVYSMILSRFLLHIFITWVFSTYLGMSCMYVVEIRYPRDRWSWLIWRNLIITTVLTQLDLKHLEGSRSKKKTLQ